MVIRSFQIPITQTLLEAKLNTECIEFGRESLKVCIFPPKLFHISYRVGVCVWRGYDLFYFYNHCHDFIILAAVTSSEGLDFITIIIC